MSKRRPSPWVIDSRDKPSTICEEWAGGVQELVPRLRLLGAGKCVFGKYHRLDASILPKGRELKVLLSQLHELVASLEKSREAHHQYIVSGQAQSPSWYISRAELSQLQAERRAERAEQEQT